MRQSRTVLALDKVLRAIVLGKRTSQGLPGFPSQLESRPPQIVFFSSYSIRYHQSNSKRWDSSVVGYRMHEIAKAIGGADDPRIVRGNSNPFVLVGRVKNIG